MRERMDRNKPQLEVYFKDDYEGDKSIIFWRFNHALCDGMSVVSMFAYVEDKVNKAAIPPMGRGTWAYNLLTFILFPILAVKVHLQ